MIMVHRTQTNNSIWTQELGYSNLSLGNLDRNIFRIEDMFPLQEGFDSDSKTCFPIAINYFRNINKLWSQFLSKFKKIELPCDKEYIEVIE